MAQRSQTGQKSPVTKRKSHFPLATSSSCTQNLTQFFWKYTLWVSINIIFIFLSGSFLSSVLISVCLTLSTPQKIPAFSPNTPQLLSPRPRRKQKQTQYKSTGAFVYTLSTIKIEKSLTQKYPELWRVLYRPQAINRNDFGSVQIRIIFFFIFFSSSDKCNGNL